MSPSKLNSLLTGVCVAMCIAISGSVMAQDGLRLWKPYDPQSFSGGRRSNDGMYSSLSGIYWSISTPTDGYIGATTVNGKDDTRWVFDQTKAYAQTNSMKINMMNPDTTLGTRFEVGNRRGHHGWLVSGYGLPGQTRRMSAQGASMVIRDEGNLTIDVNTQNFMLGSAPLYVWDKKTASSQDPFAGWEEVLMDDTFVFVSGLGYLWGFMNWETTGSVDEDTGGVGIGNIGLLAPLPIFFENVDVSVRSAHYSVELMYTYRAHPFTWGSMELLAGARYWEFKDEFNFTGSSLSAGELLGDVTGQREPRTGLLGMLVNAEGVNRVFGPQVGMKLSRQNARWTFGAEGRLTAGINVQSVKTEGNLLPRTSYPNGIPGGMWGPIGLQNSNLNFGHRQNKTYFSPIGELRFTADFQLTNAVSLFGAVDGMAAGNIARGVRVTDYVVKSDGTIFGIRGNDRNTDVFVYGVEAGVKVNR